MSRLFASGGQSIGASTSHSYTCVHSLYIHKHSRWFASTEVTLKSHELDSAILLLLKMFLYSPIEECSLGQISHF